MSRPLVSTRKNRDGETEYYCEYCVAWMKGYIWYGRDYPIRICEGCDNDLDDQPLDNWDEPPLETTQEQE